MTVPNHCTKRLVQKWETGEHAACRPDYLRVLQAVTGLSVRELGFRLQSDESGLSTAAEAANATGTDGNPAATHPAGSVGISMSPLSMAGLTEYSPNGTIEGSMDRLRHALEHPSMVDSRTADFVETATARLFDLQHHSPSRLLAPTVDRHLTTVTGLLTAARHESVRRRLMMCAGRTAALAGWLAFDRGDIASAHRYWDTSISAAEGTVDAPLLAASLTCLSYSAARRGDPGTAWQLAHTASTHTPEDRRATAWSTARAALHAAELGERDAAQLAMDRALDLGKDLPKPRPGDGGQPWTRFFDQPRLLSATARTAAILRHPRAATYATEAVSLLGPARVKARAIVLAESALVAAIVGELELCLDYGASAATLTREMDVSVAADILYTIVPLVLPYSDTRAIRELLPQLTQLTRSADLTTQAKQDGEDEDEDLDGEDDLDDLDDDDYADGEEYADSGRDPRSTTETP